MRRLRLPLLAVVTFLPALALAGDAPALVRDHAELDVVLVPTAKTGPAALKGLRAPKLGRGIEATLATRPAAGLPGFSDDDSEHVTQTLSADDVTAFRAAKEVAILHFEWAVGRTDALKTVYETLQRLTARHHLLVFDIFAMRTANAAQWRERVQVGWKGGTVYAPGHFAIHQVALDDRTVLLDTGGLTRLGLCELGLEGVTHQETRAAASLINALAQRLAEGSRPDAKGRLLLRLAELKNLDLRRELEESSYENAKGELTIELQPSDGSGEVDEGMFALGFPTLTCSSRGECLTAALTELFGYQDSTTTVDHDSPEYQLATRRAVTGLKALGPAFQKGLPPGEHLLVKAPFAHAEGNEWMWVEVQSWRRGTLTGSLQNTPEFVKDLASGATVKVKVADVGDYMHMFPDGTFEGNETGKVINPELFEQADNGRWRIVE